MSTALATVDAAFDAAFLPQVTPSPTLSAALAELLDAGEFMRCNPMGFVTPGADRRWRAAVAQLAALRTELA